MRNILSLHVIDLIRWVPQGIRVSQTRRPVALLFDRTKNTPLPKPCAGNRFAMRWRDILPLWTSSAWNLRYPRMSERDGRKCRNRAPSVVGDGGATVRLRAGCRSGDVSRGGIRTCCPLAADASGAGGEVGRAKAVS